MKAHSSTTSPLEIPQISNIKIIQWIWQLHWYYIKQNCISPSKKHIHHIKLLHCNSSCLPLTQRLKLAIEITNGSQPLMYSIVFYPFPSFFQYFPSWNVCCFANGAWSSAIVVVLIPKPQKPQIPPPQVTETTERPWKAQLWQLWNANTNPCWTLRWKDHER